MPKLIQPNEHAWYLSHDMMVEPTEAMRGLGAGWSIMAHGWVDDRYLVPEPGWQKYVDYQNEECKTCGHPRIDHGKRNCKQIIQDVLCGCASMCTCGCDTPGLEL